MFGVPQVYTGPNGKGLNVDVISKPGPFVKAAQEIGGKPGCLRHVIAKLLRFIAVFVHLVVPVLGLAKWRKEQLGQEYIAWVREELAGERLSLPGIEGVEIEVRGTVKQS